MITTITTSTVTTVTTIAAMGLTAAVSMIAVATLLGFLTTKELAGAMSSSVSQRLARYITIGVLPMVIVFVVVVAVKIFAVLA